MGAQAEIWAWRLGEGGAEEKEEEEKEKTPHMCESIGHRPLRGRCPKRKATRKATVKVRGSSRERKEDDEIEEEDKRKKR